MKKIEKAITKDNLFTTETMSFDDKKNSKYFDNLSYQIYLKNLSIENGGNNGNKRNHNNLQRSRKNTRTKKSKK